MIIPAFTRIPLTTTALRGFFAEFHPLARQVASVPALVLRETARGNRLLPLVEHSPRRLYGFTSWDAFCGCLVRPWLQVYILRKA